MYRLERTRNSAFVLLFLFMLLFITRSPYLAQSSISCSPLVDSHDCEIDLHNIKIDISNVDQVTIAERYTARNIQNVSMASIELWINQSLSNLMIQDSEGPLEFELNMFTHSSHLIDINFRTELEKNSTTNINLWYSLTNHPIPQQGNSYFFFEFISSVTYFTKEQIIEIRLPERSIIHEEEGVTSFFPTGSIPIAGRRVFISWSFTNIEPYDNALVFIRFDKPLGKFPIWPLIVSPCCGIIFGICGTLWFMKRREKKIVKKVTTIFLSDTQKLLLNLILENNGKILQKELCSKTGFTKSRVSRNITPLVDQKL
ncbi:MAG: MarR family transcriptional regulator, partial [Candidatus Heimdallarchaeaceae archaeon]